MIIQRLATETQSSILKFLFNIFLSFSLPQLHRHSLFHYPIQLHALSLFKTQNRKQQQQQRNQDKHAKILKQNEMKPKARKETKQNKQKPLSLFCDGQLLRDTCMSN